MPTMSPTTPMTIIPTTSGRTPGSIPGRVDVPIVVYARFGSAEGHEDAHEEADQQRDQERSPDPPRADADRREGAGDGDRDEQQHPVEHAPADRAEDPFTEEQRGPDDRQDDREDDDRDRDADVGRDLLDLARDRSGLGLGKVDVRLGEPERGVACRADRRTQAWGWQGPVRVRSSRMLLQLGDGAVTSGTGRSR